MYRVSEYYGIFAIGRNFLLTRQWISGTMKFMNRTTQLHRKPMIILRTVFWRAVCLRLRVSSEGILVY